jgi:hypothetical protein
VLGRYCPCPSLDLVADLNFQAGIIAAHQCLRDKHEETAPASKPRFKDTRLFRLAEETPIYLFRFAPTID